MMNFYMDGLLKFLNIWAPPHEPVDADLCEVPKFNGNEYSGTPYLIAFMQFMSERGFLYEDGMMNFLSLVSRTMPRSGMSLLKKDNFLLCRLPGNIL